MFATELFKSYTLVISYQGKGIPVNGLSSILLYKMLLLIVARDVNVALINRVLIATSRLVLLLVRREG